jgi:hypothetical protein
MRDSPLTSIYDHWTQPSYEVRVRGTTPGTATYLWGSAGITENIPFAKPLLLHVRNDLFGEPVTVGTQVGGGGGATSTVGTLQAGECVSIPVYNMSGVFAFCPLTPLGETVESVVACLIRESS